MCFICRWNTRFTGDQYNTRNWPSREQIKLGGDNIIEISHVPIEKLGIVHNETLHPEHSGVITEKNGNNYAVFKCLVYQDEISHKYS